jgi:hypothetical protein
MSVSMFATFPCEEGRAVTARFCPLVMYEGWRNTKFIQKEHGAQVGDKLLHEFSALLIR